MTDYPGGWFGTHWAGAPICEEMQRRRTPVGQECCYCNKPIEAGDSGLLMPQIPEGTLTAIHRPCFLRHIGVAP